MFFFSLEGSWVSGSGGVEWAGKFTFGSHSYPGKV